MVVAAPSSIIKLGVWDGVGTDEAISGCIAISAMLVTETDEADAAEFNAFLYWRRPLINLDGAAPVAEDTDDFLRWPLDGRDASSQSASASTVSSPDPEGLDRARIEGHHDHTTLVDMEEEEEEPEDDDLALLRGGAGARLLAVLGQLSQHLGPQSRCPSTFR